MGDVIIDLLREFNIFQLLGMGLITWIFYNRLDKKIIENKIEIKNEISKLSDKVEDIDRRLYRIEGSLATQGHCLFNQAHKEKQAE